MLGRRSRFFFFFFNDTATTEIYTLSLHDALPISIAQVVVKLVTTSKNKPITIGVHGDWGAGKSSERLDRKSTRLNSSHTVISYAVFCLKKKKKNNLDHVVLHASL